MKRVVVLFWVLRAPVAWRLGAREPLCVSRVDVLCDQHRCDDDDDDDDGDAIEKYSSRTTHEKVHLHTQKHKHSPDNDTPATHGRNVLLLRAVITSHDRTNRQRRWGG